MQQILNQDNVPRDFGVELQALKDAHKDEKRSKQKSMEDPIKTSKDKADQDLQNVLSSLKNGIKMSIKQMTSNPTALRLTKPKLPL